jgi:hypothetical protein
VPTLRLTSAADRPVLLLDGEELIGAKQNRVLNTIVLAAHSKLTIPVSCVEQGRGAYKSARFAAGDASLYASVRALKAAKVVGGSASSSSPRPACSSGRGPACAPATPPRRSVTPPARPRPTRTLCWRASPRRRWRRRRPSGWAASIAWPARPWRAPRWWSRTRWRISWRFRQLAEGLGRRHGV